MDEFKVSVIIPVYNAEKYIRKAIESALMQDEVGEVVVVEDKSPDHSLQLSEEMALKDQRIRLYQHPDKQNHGAGATRNLGIEKAKFNYISFLDADDYYLPGRFKKDKELFTKFPEIDGVYNALGTDYYENVEKAAIPKKFLTTINKQVAPNDLFFSILRDGSGWLHSDTITVKKEVFNKVGTFDPTMKLSQDTHLWMRVAAMCKLMGGEINEPVAMRGVHLQNRVNDLELLYHYKRVLYAKLLNWAIAKKLPVDKKRILWKHSYQLRVLDIPRSKMKRFTDAMRELAHYPFILGYSEYYKTIPFITRFVK